MCRQDVFKEMLIEKGPEDLVVMLNRLLWNTPIRRMIFRSLEGKLARDLRSLEDPRRIEEERKLIVSALLHSIDEALRERRVSKMATAGFLRYFVSNALIDLGFVEATTHDGTKQDYEHRGFLVISPGRACNLECSGCYASSGTEKLEWEIFDRIISEAKRLWGCRFFVLSGGEPLLYKSSGKGVLDAAEKHNDCFFLMYTNGALIDKQLAMRMVTLGNISPALSVEGMRDRTDAWRGSGVFAGVLQAMANLREVGVPFGIAVTATRLNYDEVLSEEFLGFFFEKQRAMYGWIFPYVPIGRKPSLELLPTPEQRMCAWWREWEIIKTRRIFLVDFGNFGSVSGGCIGAGREAGFLAIDWNGDVTYCVFSPYSPVNIIEVFENGGDLNDIWRTPFFEAIRRWQESHRLGEGAPSKPGNLLMHCPSSYPETFRDLVDQYKAKPIDEGARKLLKDSGCFQELKAHKRRFGEISNKVWETEYLGL